MPIDSSIALQSRNPVFESPVNALSQMLQAQGIQQQNQLGQYQLGNMQRADTERNALADLYKTSVKPDGSIDRQALIQGAATRGIGGQIPGLQKGFSDQDKAAADAKKLQYETVLQKIDIGSRILSSAKDEPSYQAAVQQTAQALGPEAAAQLPPSFNPQAVQALLSQGLSIKDKIAAEHQQLVLQETGRHNLSTEGLTAQQITEQGRHNVNTERVAAGQLGVSQANLGLSRERLAQEKAAPRGVVNADLGVIIDPVTGTTKPITADGVPVGPKAPKLKEIPVSVDKGIRENQQTISAIDRAIKEIESQPDSIGWKYKIPGMESLGQYTDPEGVSARAGVADIGSLKLHDRSGASVTASETPRLSPFIPSVGDRKDAALTKLRRLKTEAESETQLLNEQYSADQGFKPSPILARSGASSGGVPADIADILKKHGGK